MIAFVRHGQTASNSSGRLQGRVDTPLTEVGIAQAHAVAARFANEPLRRVFSSPLRRALDMAALIATPHDLPVELDDRLLELDYGDWDGRPIRDVTAQQWADWRADPTLTVPGGESLVAVTARIIDFCADVLGDDLVVAVSHVSPIKAAVCFALGVDETAIWRMQLGLGTISRVGARPDNTPYLESFNEAPN
jgi:broad specificity phosphatase PhoE